MYVLIRSELPCYVPRTTVKENFQQINTEFVTEMSKRQSTPRNYIRNAEEFSIAFAIAVTEASDDPLDWIAKKGKDSIFVLLNQIFPQASTF